MAACRSHQDRHHRRGRPVDPGEPEAQGAADLLRRAAPPTTRSSAVRAAPRRASTTPTRRATPTPAPAACRSATSSTARRSPPSTASRTSCSRSDQRQLEDPVQPRPGDRVQKVAPFLTTDTDPTRRWSTVGSLDRRRLHDAPNYPYAEQVAFGAATTDSLNTAQPRQNQTISYIRNSVKATVDAYNGTVTLYAFDDADPVLKAWRRRSRARAAQDAIARACSAPALPGGPVQGAARAAGPLPRRATRASSSAARTFWEVPNDPTVQRGRGRPQPPYYLLAGAPGAADAGHRRSSSPARCGSEPRHPASYCRPAPIRRRTGRCTVLQLPSDTQTPGPQQVQRSSISRPRSAPTHACSRAGQTAVDYGNLLTLRWRRAAVRRADLHRTHRPGVQLSTAGQGARLLRRPHRLRADAGAGAGPGVRRGCGQRHRGRGAGPGGPAQHPTRRGRPLGQPAGQAAATAIQTAIDS